MITKQCMHSQWLQVRIQLDFARILLKATRQLITHGCPVRFFMPVGNNILARHPCIATINISIEIGHFVIVLICLVINTSVKFVFLSFACILEIH